MKGYIIRQIMLTNVTFLQDVVSADGEAAYILRESLHKKIYIFYEKVVVFRVL